MNDQLKSIETEFLQEQLKARNVMKREMVFFYAVFLIGAIGFFLFGSRSGLGIVAFLIFLFILRTASVWYQWNFLKRFQLKCPFCKQPLAKRTNFLISPSPYCPYCKQRALVPIKQLVEFEKSINS